MRLPLVVVVVAVVVFVVEVFLFGDDRIRDDVAVANRFPGTLSSSTTALGTASSAIAFHQHSCGRLYSSRRSGSASAPFHAG